MTERLVPVLLAALLVLAGCSQLASAPNDPTETTTAVGTDVGDATPAPTATPNGTVTATATGTTPTTTGTVQGSATTTGGASTPTVTRTTTAGTPSPTPTATQSSAATPSPTTIPSPTATPTPESHFVVVIGGSPEEKVTYEFSVTGTIERRGRSYGAPIDDDGVTRDPDIDVIAPNRSSVSGRLGGGGDAYRITGEITDFEAADGDAVAVYVDGERIEIDD